MGMHWQMLGWCQGDGKSILKSWWNETEQRSGGIQG